MLCFRYRKLLIPYSEGGLDDWARERVERHILRCRHCERDLRAIRRVSSALIESEQPSVEPAPDLWARVNARIADHSPSPRRARWARVSAAWSAGAAVVLIAAVGIGLLRAGLPTSMGHRSAPVLPAPAVVTADKPVAGLPQAARKAISPAVPRAVDSRIIAKSKAPAPSAAGPVDTCAVPVASPAPASRAVAVPPAPAEPPSSPVVGSAAVPEMSAMSRSMTFAADVPARAIGGGTAPKAKQADASDTVGNLRAGFHQHPTATNADMLVSAQQQTRQLDHGIAEQESILRKDARDTRAMLYLLSAYRATGNIRGRIRVATELARANPAGASDYYSEIGAACMAAGDTGAAVDAYSRALDAGDATAWTAVARSAVDSGAVDPLLSRCESAFERNPTSRAGKVLFELQSARGDVTGAVRTAGALVKRFGDDPTAWLKLGEAHERAGDRKAAAAAYLRAVSGSDPATADQAKARLSAIGQ